MKNASKARPPAPSATTMQPPARLTPASALLATLGLLLVVLSTLPVYRLLATPETGLAGASTATQLDIYWDLIQAGLLLLLPVFLIGARFVPATVEAHLTRAGDRLASFPSVPYAAMLALIAAGLGTAFVLLVLEGLPNLIDAHAQLLHARYWAEGRLAGPPTDGGGFWLIQNSLFTENGWVSQYPPGHVAVLAVFIALGIPWASGPVMMAVTVFFGALAVERLLPGRRAVARLGALLLAVSPFFIAIGASYMNHVTTAAMVALGTYALLRAWHGRVAWSILAGAAFGLSLTTRPLSTVAMGAAIFLLVPFTAPAVGRAARFARITLLTVAGAAPFAALLMAYNRHFFGGPFTFGYEVALGPQMRLGLHRDPWGNMYGLREAIGYTSSDLMALGLNLMETPLPAVLVIGLFLLLVRRLEPGERVLAGWAMAPVVSNFFYWHHGLFMGPRMLAEAAPAWVFLFVVALAGLIGRLPPARAGARLQPRTGLITMTVAAMVFGLLVMAPQRVRSYGGEWMAMMRTPEPELDGAALVFVHDAWTARIGMTLASHGYSLDVVETLLRQNPTCRVQEMADAVAHGDRDRETRLYDTLDLEPRAHGFPEAVTISPGNRIRVSSAEPLTERCVVEARADTRGVLGLAPFLWRGALPGTARSGILYVQDLGPDRNRTAMEAFPGLAAYVYMMPDPAARAPVLLPYDEGMRALWQGGDDTSGPPAPAGRRPPLQNANPLQNATDLTASEGSPGGG
ncbi:MAG TPA: glycosyltransferase family 39 protein [Longimicrobiales bacterium]|nr:glycosyltransferase family 39 protein [Longimicrobiales bacterium]